MDIWDGVTNFLKKTVPIAANVFVPGSGGVVSSIISTVFGVDADDPQAVAQAIKEATPEQIIALKEMVFKHEERLIDLATENEKIRLRDVQDARKMSTDLVKLTGKSDYNKNLMSWLTIIGFLAAITAILSGYATTDNNPVVLLMLGALISHVDQVYGYFFGSSKSSSDKTNLMANMK
jgi:hypothetical protein